MDDLPGREQQDGRLAGAVHLVEHADAGALQVALGVGIARPRLLAPHPYLINAITHLTAAGIPGLAPGPGTPPAAGVRHGRASNTRLNGVSAARRKRVKPARPDDVPDPRLAGLRAQGEADVLGERGGRAQQGGERRSRHGRPD